MKDNADICVYLFGVVFDLVGLIMLDFSMPSTVLGNAISIAIGRFRYPFILLGTCADEDYE